MQDRLSRAVRIWVGSGETNLRLNQLTQPAQSDRFTAGIRFTVFHTNHLAPVRRFISKLIEKSCFTTGHELAAVGANCGQLLFPLIADVEYQRWLNRDLQMNAVIVVNALGVPWFAGH